MFEELKPHLVELRKRLGLSVASVILAFVVCFTVWNPILAWMTEPLKAVLPDGSNIIFTQVQEPFFTAMKVAFFAGLIVSLPIIFWQFWLFVAPGLYENEKKYVVPFVLAATIMFLCGAAFCYYVVIPLGFTFLVNFGGQLFTALPSIGEYVGFFTKLLVAFGIAFELPVITFFFAKLGLVDDIMLKKYFRYAVVIIFIFSAIVTPPDVISQFLMAFPLMGLYGLSILIAKSANKKEEDEEPAQENEK
ncbi:twin-arginine translocase subunit TatC [Campylobacter sp. RM9344]|uniref:Sec-independent protein translocase protein TatC n=1 Tax=Campylobacter californiensis TaxID=1032243 RepID=A0AAW3ZSX3_9BACT|nr:MULTISPECIES: twin-arginine translocase subunit TatC [unclassified Campylobacter]MBE2984793.1 twin-arginine translocase subunit TatC [Campylobacter sp. RM6883]MBE2986497.1 twin-arginine translocase subunit TatC [Campylobacter sp. RM12919]MBE2987697.1 twin-arginine translocase subunit TatC [Campylobacter sp. RM12920]MBE2994741.1 twin-arginine translocase subunit TatC [Campylobacter sp. RM6913]MBE3029607.1 twin-arginine translocase subunit TatC [Campylobacter sp. RM9344]